MVESEEGKGSRFTILPPELRRAQPEAPDDVAEEVDQGRPMQQVGVGGT
jgi:hypothetical protein